MRADARRSVQKIRQAAVELFAQEGLHAPIEEVARRAGVSKGTIYHRFGTREGLIDAVADGLVASQLTEITARVLALSDPWQRLESYLREMWALQRHSPAANHAFARTYPDAETLARVCDNALSVGDRLVREAISAGAARHDLTAEDVFFLIWSTGTIIQAAPPGSGSAIDRHCNRLIDGLRRPRIV